ncbi:hypothetical protein [Desulfolucanica intricata]|uniref:hypothetical protein n=1 Tax=Desulfolucanica intricata TaxID=1285191 RepID=UPI00082C68F5|nr:hypothetical protein [Desulfolucanica intricata]
MRLYFRTTSNAADIILREGFKNCSENINLMELAGIWLHDIMLNFNENLSKKVLLAVDLDIADDELTGYVVKDDDIPYAEYLVPVDIINKKGIIQVVRDKAEKELAYLDYLDNL